MECREVRSLADAYLSEELLVETTHAVVQHLERCPACRSDLEARRGLRDALRSAFERAPDLQPSSEFLSGLRTRLRDELPGRRQTGWRTWLAMAAGIILTAGLGTTGVMWLGERALTELAHLAGGDHQNCALKFALPERPITLTEAAVFDPAFGRLEAVAFLGRTTSNNVFEFVERHSCVYQGQRFAHIVVRYKGRAVSLLVADKAGSRGGWWRATDAAPRALAADGGFNIASFRTADRSVFVVSTLPSADVQEVAHAVAAPIAVALAGI